MLINTNMRLTGCVLISIIFVILQVAQGFQPMSINNRNSNAVSNVRVGSLQSPSSSLSPLLPVDSSRTSRCLSQYKTAGSRPFLPFGPLCMSSDAADGNEIITCRIKVKGDVGGYYRACVQNEAGKFRRLTGTMLPPDDVTGETEIYVEGERKMVDGFVRWAKRGKVGLSQVTEVTNVEYGDEPLGLYDEFYCKK